MPYDPSSGLIAGANAFNSIQEQGEKARAWVTSLFDTQARRQAGGLLQNGDYDSAVGLLASRGLTDEATRIATLGETRRKAALEQQRLQSRTAIGSSLLIPSGPAGLPDYTGAANKALAAGDTDYASSILSAAKDATGQQREHLADINSTMGQAAVMLDQVPPQDFDKGFDHFVDYFKQLNMDDTAIAKMREQARDPTRRKAFIVQAQGVDKYLTSLREGASAAEIHRHNVAMENDPKYVAVPEGGKLVPTRGVPLGGSAAPPLGPVGRDATASAAPALSDVQELLTTGLPGTRVTSTLRSPEHNAAVGGAPNSNHLRGTAIDFVPPPGTTKAQVRAMLEQQGVHIRELLGPGDPGHSDHFHVAIDPPVAPYRVASAGAGLAPSRSVASPGDPPGTLYGAPRPQARRMSADEVAAAGFRPGTVAYVDPKTGKPDVVQAPREPKEEPALKPIPAQMQGAILDNRKGLSKIDAAIALVRTSPHALGMKGMLPDGLLQRVDKSGVDVRAAVADIGSQLIHDRSGAAVTAAEAPRLKPFVPKVDDTAETALKKLVRMRQEFVNANNEIELLYGEDSGYRPLRKPGRPSQQAPAAPVRVSSVAEAMALKPGTPFITPDGRRKVRP